MIKLRNINMKIFMLYLILKPVYILEDNPFQIADIILLIGFCILLLNIKNILKKGRIKKLEWIIILYFIIVLYQLIINVVAYLLMVGNDFEYISLLKNNLYYVFNLISMYYFYLLYILYREKILYTFCSGSLYSMCLIFLGLFINMGTSRNSSFFNNPNQLGYYALIVSTGMFILKYYYSSIQKIMLISISIICVIMSVSKASILGLGILYGIFLINYIFKLIIRLKKEKLYLKKRLVKYTLSMSILCLFVFNKIKNVLLNYSMTLINRIQEKSNNLYSSRGYGRISEIGYKIFTGVGEGAFNRFTIMKGNETHSTYATILISYGVIGMLLYSYLFFLLNNKKIKLMIKFVFIFSGVLVYWLSHNGLRHTMLWITFIIYTISLDLDKNANQL